MVEVTIVDAALTLKANSKYTVGKGTEAAYNRKLDQYSNRFPGLDVETQLRILAVDLRGGLSEYANVYLQEICKREHRSKPLIPYSVVASRLYQRVSVAIQRAVAYNVMEFRYWRVPATVPGATMPAVPPGAAQAVGGASLDMETD